MTEQRFIIKSLFKTRHNYSNVYTTAVRYRTWLTNEIYSQLRVLKSDASIFVKAIKKALNIKGFSFKFYFNDSGT